jgi:replication-associated recombination protein RarA
MISLGNAGTGKTNSARKMAARMKEFGLLPLDKLVERNADSLVGQYIGQTAEKISELLKEAEGGVLFVDEAHRLAGGSHANVYKQEALGVIMKALEPHGLYFNKILIIFAGYKREMIDMVWTKD